MRNGTTSGVLRAARLACSTASARKDFNKAGVERLPLLSRRIAADCAPQSLLFDTPSQRLHREAVMRVDIPFRRPP
jgi:hypothetical protein